MPPVSCYYLCYVFLWPQPVDCALLLINATHFPFLASVTTIILATSLRSLCREEKYSSWGFRCCVRSFCSLCAIVIQFQQVALTFSFVYTIRSFIFLIDTLCGVCGRDWFGGSLVLEFGSSVRFRAVVASLGSLKKYTIVIYFIGNDSLSISLRECGNYIPLWP